MAKNSIEAYGAEGKSNVLYFDPDKLTLVTDPKHALYDERVHRPFKESMVLNIMALGVLQAILITKDPETGQTLVAVGRGRVINAREANRRLRERGEEPIQVPAIVRRTDSDGLAGVMVAENELREADSPLGRARKMQRFIERGRGHDAIAILFGCTEQTVARTLALLDAPALVREAVDSGAITLTIANKLAKLKPEEQRAKIAELKKAGEGRTGHDKAKAQRVVVDGEVKPKQRTRAQIERARDAAAIHEVRAALSWVLGERAEVT
jgi:ParB family chromosome partitioning protein